jgi:hypothetical protein
VMHDSSRVDVARIQIPGQIHCLSFTEHALTPCSARS